MPVDVLLMLLLLPVLLAGSAFFSGTETALFSISRHERRRLAGSPRPAARAVTTLLADSRALLVTLLMGNMTLNVSYFVLSSVILLRLSDAALPGWAVAAASLAPLLAIVLLGEVLPKLVAARLTQTWASLAALPLLTVHRLLTPLRAIAITLVITPLSRLINPRGEAHALTAGELEELLRRGRAESAIHATEQRVLSQVLELQRLRVRDLMVPRVDVVAFDLDRPAEQLGALVRQTRLRHIPVFAGSLDAVEGVVHRRQVLLRPPTGAEQVRRLVRRVRFVPEQQRADRLLAEMRKTGATFAIVVDEYGGTAGVITIEDLVEHLVGDIAGGYEPMGKISVEPLPRGRFRVPAGLMLIDWPDVLPLPAPRFDEPGTESITTVGGLVMARLGAVPRAGDSVDAGAVRLTVERVDGHRLVSVIVREVGASARPQTETPS